MYVPNDHLGTAHRRLLHATSDEVNAGAPVNYLVAPAQRSDAWQRLPQGSSSLPDGYPFASHCAPSPPHEAYSAGVGSTAHVALPWEGQAYKRQYAEHRLPTPPLRNDGLLPSVGQSTLSSIPSYPSSFQDILTQIGGHPKSGPNVIDDDGSTLWNTDGTGGNQDDWLVHGQSYQSPHDLCALAWEPVYGQTPQVANPTNTYGSSYVQSPLMQFAPPQPLQPRRASSIASSPGLISHVYPTQMPAVQQWRTDNLTALPRPRTFRRLPDGSTRRKQEVYRQKGEARRHTIAAGTPDGQRLAHRPLPVPGPPRTRLLDPPRTKSRKRRKLASPVICDDSPFATTVYQSPYDDLSTPYPLHAKNAVCDAPVIELPPTLDELPQSIVSAYEDYKWSVYRYELQPCSGYDFAERWLEELFATTLHSEYQHRHVSHISHGFIKDGTQLSLLILHNAAKPFENDPAPASTITVGVYGYHWYQHSEIHWTTLASDQRALVTQCVQAGFLTEQHKWTVDAVKASERRFHRAYWLAANQRDFKDLLNRGPSDDQPHDFIEEGGEEDPDKDFEISEADLACEWDVSFAEAAAAWQRVQDEIDGSGDVRVERLHVVVGSTEW